LARRQCAASRPRDSEPRLRTLREQNRKQGGGDANHLSQSRCKHDPKVRRSHPSEAAVTSRPGSDSNSDGAPATRKPLSARCEAAAAKRHHDHGRAEIPENLNPVTPPGRGHVSRCGRRGGRWWDPLPARAQAPDGSLGLATASARAGRAASPAQSRYWKEAR
jgi:hypothetical protein